MKVKSTARRLGLSYAQPKFAHYLHAHQCPRILILVLNLKSVMIKSKKRQKIKLSHHGNHNFILSIVSAAVSESRAACDLRHLVLVKSMKRLKRRRQERKENVETGKNNSNNNNIIKMQIQIGKRNKGNGKISYLLCSRRLHVLAGWCKTNERTLQWNCISPLDYSTK